MALSPMKFEPTMKLCIHIELARTLNRQPHEIRRGRQSGKGVLLEIGGAWQVGTDGKWHWYIDKEA